MIEVNYLEVGDITHCLRCHKDIPCDEILNHWREEAKKETTLCVPSCGKWYSRHNALFSPTPTTRCFGCSECLDSSARTGEECVKMRDCKCHSPLPPTEKDLAATLERVDSQVGRAVARLGGQAPVDANKLMGELHDEIASLSSGESNRVQEIIEAVYRHGHETPDEIRNLPIGQLTIAEAISQMNNLITEAKAEGYITGLNAGPGGGGCAPLCCHVCKGETPNCVYRGNCKCHNGTGEPRIHPRTSEKEV